MLPYLTIVTLCFTKYIYANSNTVDTNVIKKEHYVYWPNATVPFYIDPEHFDHEQSLSIMTTLSVFAFKTCLKFTPVLVRPAGNQHVMLFENPNGVRKCMFNIEGHSTEEPHRITLGYSCLKSPQIDMMVMRALGFPFEHNRASRDLYVDVQFENIDPGAMELFTKDSKLPPELRPLRYDVNSVTHFGDREFSKNGHRTIIFKDHNVIQNRKGLSELDIRKIEVIYGPECQKRDRQEKIDLCQNYPGVARRKRQVELYFSGPSLRMNRDITAPPDLNFTSDATETLNRLGIEKEVKEIVDKANGLSALILNNAKEKHCNGTASLPSHHHSSDTLGIIDLVTNYASSIEEHGLTNSSGFCLESNRGQYKVARCGFNGYSRNQKPTRIGDVHYSTQHRPVNTHSTKKIHGRGSVYVSRAGNETEKVRRKRSVEVSIKFDDTNKTVNDPKKGLMTAEVETDEELDAAALEKTLRFGITTKLKDHSESNVKNSPDRRRFQDFSVHKRKPNKKAQSHESDLSLESKREERTKKRIYEKKQHPTAKEKVTSIWFNTGSSMRGAQPPPVTVKLTKGSQEFYDDRRWPENVVRYIIKDLTQYDLDDVRERLEEVNDILKEKTCVRIEEITEDEARSHKDYLVLDNSPDYVTGRVGGKQHFGAVELFEGGQHAQHAAMVVMSMLGFYLEPSRHDRDRYIRVHTRHVRPDKLHHFEKLRSDATLPLPYDYRSATQPAWQYWRQLGRSGIATLATYKDQDPDGTLMKSLGQNTKLLSDTDIIKINSVYGVECF